MTGLQDPAWWEDYFSEGGGWERNGGRAQTRIFAEHFTRRFRIDRTSSFSLLDVGCALGDAIAHFARVFPKAKLHGIDFSKTAVERCRKDLGPIATFQVRDIEAVQEHYDVIYCSNSLEHFADFDVKARKLARQAARLCVLVPYRELRDGQPLVPNPSQHHQVTFCRDSFDFLVREGLARSVSTSVFSCPGAWGWPIRTRIEQLLRNTLRALMGAEKVLAPKQIFFDIATSEGARALSPNGSATP